MADDSGQRAWTVLEVLNWTTEHFRRSGISSPRPNAEVLLGKTLGLERIMLYARFDRELSPDERVAFRELVRRRSGREPMQYVIGTCEFYGREFEVTPAVMCPRQDTETVVEVCLERLPPGESWAGDICTGSGVIAVTLAAERADLRVVATDSSEEALEVARRNADRHGVSERVALVHADLAAPLAEHLPAGRTGYDMIVSNPPYVASGDIEGLEPEVRDHEPRQALDGGPDGLDVIRRLVPQAAALLVAGGRLVLEMGAGQTEAVSEIVAAVEEFDAGSAQVVTDLGGIERVFCVGRQAGEEKE